MRQKICFKDKLRGKLGTNFKFWYSHVDEAELIVAARSWNIFHLSNKDSDDS